MNPLTSDSEDQFLRHLIEAVEAGNAESFDRHIAIGKGYFTPKKLVDLLVKALPLQLKEEQIPTLQLLLVDGDQEAYRRDVNDFLEELEALLGHHGLKPGIDFGRLAGDDDLPRLWLGPEARAMAEEYGDWRMVKPYCSATSPEA
jgi:hypothetical protein